MFLSTQHDEDVTQEQIHEDIKKYVFDPIRPKELIDGDTKFFSNPTGRFVIGGPHGDAGLTGRKIIVDTYGGYARPVAYTHLDVYKRQEECIKVWTGHARLEQPCTHPVRELLSRHLITVDTAIMW